MNIYQSLYFLIFMEFVIIKTLLTHKHVKYEYAKCSNHNDQRNIGTQFLLTIVNIQTIRSILNAKLQRMYVETVHCI
jgi:hypothetical protein